MATKLTNGDYAWNNSEQVIIKSADLINDLINDSDGTIKALSGISPIKLSNITVDEYGTVIVTDAEFKRIVEKNIPGGPVGQMAGNNFAAVCINKGC